MRAFIANNYPYFKQKVLLNHMKEQDFFDSLLYHTKNYQGTTTAVDELPYRSLLYHANKYKNYSSPYTYIEEL